MAKIAQRELFGWKDVENLGDLKRLKLVIETVPDEELMQILMKARGNGRDDYPVQAMWNSLLAGIVFEHKSCESLRRELGRNGQLRQLCGFSPFSKVPTRSAYSRFLKTLLAHAQEIEKIFDQLVKDLIKLLPDYGKDLAIDGKALHSIAKKEGKHSEDHRGDHDANWGIKKYKGVQKDGAAWEKIVKWFGYRLHLISDAKYELPVHFKVTTASCSEVKVADTLLKELSQKHPSLITRAQYLMADKGYDSTALIQELWETYAIKPVIDIRSMWKDKEPSKMIDHPKVNNVCYGQKGAVVCYCPRTGQTKDMVYKGFEKKRETHKYQCPAKAYGIECMGKDQCLVKDAVRIPRKQDLRIFTPVARSTLKWKKLYNMRSSIERINSRIDVSFGFENHYIRGLQKMKVKMGIALIVMLSMAVGRIRQNQGALMRSLVKAA